MKRKLCPKCIMRAELYRVAKKTFICKDLKRCKYCGELFISKKVKSK